MGVKGLRGLLGIISRAVTSARRVPGPTPQEIRGYFLPQPSDSLTGTPERQRYLQQVWENCALPAELYQQLYWTPLAQLLVRVQNVPAASSGPWSGDGGYGDMVLKYVSCAVRLTRAHLLPPESPPEVQAVQGVLWQAVVFWSALCYHLPLLGHFRGEQLSGTPWIPGLNEPREPFRFAVNPTSLSTREMQSLAALQAGQLLPIAATHWLATVPMALDCLALRLNGFSSPQAVIDLILESAVEKSGAVHIPRREAGEPVEASRLPSLVSPGQVSVRSDRCAVVRTSSPTAAHDSACPPVLSPAPEALSCEIPAATFAAGMPPGAAVAPAGTSPEGRKTERGRDRGRMPQTTEAVSSPDAVGGDLQEGQTFWQWLRVNLREGNIPVNDPGGGLQLVRAYLLIPVPSTFFLYLKLTGRNGDERAKVQRGFEKLGNHSWRKKRQFFVARLYASGDGQGPFTLLNGYLVKAYLLFDTVPPDSPYLIMASAVDGH